jgi:hypothetical protein
LRFRASSRLPSGIRIVLPLAVSIVATAGCSSQTREKTVQDVPSAGEKSGLDRVLDETLVPGERIGELKLGEPADPLIMRLLGPTSVVTRSGDIEILEYTKDYLKNDWDLEIHVSPPGPEGKIVAVFVERNFRGETNKGVRIGDPATKVKQLHGQPEIETENAWIYEDGTRFWFHYDRVRRMGIKNPEFGPRARIGRTPARSSTPRNIAQEKPWEDQSWEEKFASLLSWCKSNPKGEVMLAASHVPSDRPQLKNRLPFLKVPEFCECRLYGMRDAFGVEMAVRLERPGGSTPDQVQETFKRRQKLRLDCLERYTE